MPPLAASTLALTARLGTPPSWLSSWLSSWPSPTLIALLAALALNGLTWAAFRLDKALARASRRRISERTLLTLTVLGGLGAVLGMYAHRQRHKTQKPRFVAVALIATALQAAALAALAMRALGR